MMAVVGEGVPSPLPGLAIHGGTEPSAHALGYCLSALRALGHGLGGCSKKKAVPVEPERPVGRRSAAGAYFFLAAFLAGLAAAAFLRFSSMATWAAARRATGTRYGEQLT